MDNTNTCERAEDLVGFLYGELSETDARRFERHLRECGVCDAEFKAFGQIHTSIVEWRNESLGAHSPAFSEESRIQATAQARMEAKPSAIVALREFFALSPLWMKGVAAFAAVLFFICAALAVAYLQGRPPASDEVKQNGDRIYTPQDVNDQVKQAIEKKRIEMETAQRQRQDVVVKDQSSTRTSVSGSPASRRIVGNPRRPFTREERQELAADLRLVTSRDDDDLDLTTDSNRPKR